MKYPSALISQDNHIKAWISDIGDIILENPISGILYI